MAADATTPTEALLRYVAAHTVQEDAYLRRMRSAATRAGIPRIHIAAEQASLMQVLLRLAGAREVVEVGTLFGYSALWMARALPRGGRVRTIEVDEAHAAFARRWLARSDAAARVQVLHGAGAEILPGLETDSADAAFLDADKGGYGGYLRECLRIVRPGGLIMADNAFAFGELLDRRSRDPGVKAIRRFNDLVAAHPGLQGVIVPLGDGLWVAVRR
ncbi:MAG: O-methyltransferase [Planctomycetes bacterium]|nr:O-methyltransferase [Planctomycetota bacterium]